MEPDTIGLGCFYRGRRVRRSSFEILKSDPVRAERGSIRNFDTIALTLFAGLASILLASCAADASNQSQIASTSQPNILFVLSDDHSVPHAGCYGGANVTRLGLTPALDDLAEQGVCFDRAYTTSPQCAPSRISLFAARNPVDLGVTRFAQPARPSVRFFTDILRENGYWAGLNGRAHHLTGRGFEPPHIQDALEGAGLVNIDERFDYISELNTKVIDNETLGDEVLKSLEGVPEGKPFFLYFGFNQPHRAFHSDASDIDPAALLLPTDWPDLPEVRADYARFLSDVRELDKGFGSIMSALDEAGLSENTIVIFMGDNGEAMNRGKGTLYERGTKVPLIIRWPGKLKAGTRNRDLISGVDIGVTILDAAGLEPEDEMAGVSFLPALIGVGASSRELVFAERGWHFGPLTDSQGVDYARSVSDERYKLIYNAQPRQPYSPVDQGGKYHNRSEEAREVVLPALEVPDADVGHESWQAVKRSYRSGTLSPLMQQLYFAPRKAVFELYDLEADPYELTNLSGDASLAERERKLREALDVWMVSNQDYLPLPTHVYQQTPRSELRGQERRPGAGAP